jgi:hypothetical protein|uniref:RNA polymerase-associated protein LEO1 n=1 Tax=Eutreptiella gymnastica TaxID=73025 RepID=A0A7S4LN21_9EUGL
MVPGHESEGAETPTENCEQPSNAGESDEGGDVPTEQDNLVEETFNDAHETLENPEETIERATEEEAFESRAEKREETFEDGSAQARYPDEPETTPKHGEDDEEEDFDALAAFEAAEAAEKEAQREHAPRPEQHGVDESRLPLDGGDEDPHWEAIFGDDEAQEIPGEGEAEKDLTYAAIFGDAAEDEDALEQDVDVLDVEPGAHASQGLSFEQLFGEEEMHRDSSSRPVDDVDLRMASKLAEIRIPRIPKLPEAEKKKLYYVKIPQALHFEERPYDPSNLAKELERNHDRVITPDNVVRWRHMGDSGEEQVQSNARIVQWDNGDMHLFVGREVYDISKHSLGQDNNYLFARSLDGTHIFQHKFQSSMRIRTTLSKNSNVGNLVGKKIKSSFNKKIMGRELKMGLTDEIGQAPMHSKDLQKLQRKRDRVMRDSEPGAVVGVGENNAADDDEEEERVERLRKVKRTGGVEAVRRPRPDDDNLSEL